MASTVRKGDMLRNETPIIPNIFKIENPNPGLGLIFLKTDPDPHFTCVDLQYIVILSFRK